MFSPLFIDSFLDAAIQATLILFTAICLFFSVVIWFTFFNLQRIKTVLNQAQENNLIFQKELRLLENKIQIKKLNPLELLIQPAILFKILDLVFMFRAGKLTNWGFIKTLFK